MKIQTFNIVAGTTACNANCPFCISRMTPLSGVNQKLQETNWINFRKACEMAKMNGVNTVLLTGKGEPLLFPDQITSFLKEIEKYAFPIIEMQTNALVIGRDFKKLNPYLGKWRNLGLNTFVISIVHYKDEENKKIYSPNADYINLEKTITYLHEKGFSVRLNCIMIKDFIDTIEEVKNLVGFCKKNEVEQLTLKPVEMLKNQNTPQAKWAKDNLIPIKVQKKIQLFLEKEGNRLRTLDFGGVVYDLYGQNVCFTDCLTGRPFTEDLRQLIFFPDGHLRYYWQYQGAILL